LVVATNPNSPTFAQKLWQEVSDGRETVPFAFWRFCFSARDIIEQVASMPEAMLLAFRDLATPVPNAKGVLVWPDAATRITSLDLDAFGSVEAACKRRQLRLEELQSAIEQRLQREDKPLQR
jgi:hypothetical protein